MAKDMISASSHDAVPAHPKLIDDKLIREILVWYDQLHAAPATRGTRHAMRGRTKHSSKAANLEGIEFLM